MTYRDCSIAEAIHWGIAPGMDADERSERQARWERRKARKDVRKADR